MIVLQGAQERVDFLRFSPDGCMLVVPCQAGVQIWGDLAGGGGPASMLAHARVSSARFSPDGRKLLLQGGPARAAVHDLYTGRVVEVPFLLPERGGGCDLSPDGRFVVACQNDNTRRTPGLLFCVQADDPTALVWSVASPRRLYSRPLFLPGGRRFAVLECRYGPTHTDCSFAFVTRDTGTGVAVAEVPAAGKSSPGMTSVDGRFVVALGGAWSTVLPTDDLGAAPVTFPHTGLDFHPSGRFMAATSNDATVKLYDTATWKVTQAYNWGVGRLWSVAFSPDGMLAAAGGDKGTIVVWDVDL
jgi:WD40 repeat protein